MRRAVRAALAVILCLSGAVPAIGGLKFPEVEVNYEGKIKELSPSEISAEFDWGSSLPEEVIARRAIFDPSEWRRLPKRRDEGAGCRFFFEKLRYGKLCDVYLIAVSYTHLTLPTN